MKYGPSIDPNSVLWSSDLACSLVSGRNGNYQNHCGHPFHLVIPKVLASDPTPLDTHVRVICIYTVHIIGGDTCTMHVTCRPLYMYNYMCTYSPVLYEGCCFCLWWMEKHSYMCRAGSKGGRRGANAPPRISAAPPSI